MKSCHRGFTLVELMITLTVVAILSAIALPSYQAFVESSRMTAQANDFQTALNLARSEAVKRNASITVAAKEGGWAAGWELRAGNAVFRDFPALRGGSTLSCNDDVTTITFQQNGRAGATNVTCELDSASGKDPGRDIMIEASGRTSVSKP